MIPTDELHELALPDGGRVVADVSFHSGIRLTRFDAANRELARYELEYPSAGFGGGGWVLSPSGKLLVLHYSSGQSEETFALLDLSNRALRLVASPGYERGEYSSYAFSPTEDTMVVALPRTCEEWRQAWEDDGLEVAEDGVDVLPFATLLLCSTDSGAIRRTELELAPKVPEPVNPGEYDPDLAPEFRANSSSVSVQLPWGRVNSDLAEAPLRVRIPYPPEPGVPTAR
jgi:hypothetical protein